MEKETINDVMGSMYSVVQLASDKLRRLECVQGADYWLLITQDLIMYNSLMVNSAGCCALSALRVLSRSLLSRSSITAPLMHLYCST